MATWTKRYADWVNLVVTATESEVNIANNTSKVTVVVQLKSTSTTRVWNETSQSLSVSIDGTNVGSRNFTYSIYNKGTVTLGTYSRVVTHNSDGTKSARVQVSASGGGDSASFSESLTLTNIARASIPTVSASSVAIGSKVTINFNRKSTSFRHELTYAFAGTSGTLVSTGSNVASYAWTLPNSLADAIPSKTSNGLTFTLKTYNGSTQVGSHNISITVTVPNNSTFNPSITTPTRTELTSAINTYMSGTIINGRSRIRFSSTATTRYSASVSNIQIRFTHSGGGTWTYNASGSGTTRTYDWNANNASGTWTVVMIVTDSRGRTATSSSTRFSVTAYTAPKLTVATANRDATTSTTLRLNVTATNSSISGKNQMTFKVYTKPRSSSTWSASKHTVTSTNGTISLSNHAITSYSETESYDVQFEVYDRLTNSIYAEVTVGTTSVLLDAYKDKGIGIGRMYNAGTGGSLQVGGLATFDGDIRQTGTGQDVRLVIDPVSGNASMEIGSTKVASTPYIDFHTTGKNNDRDARIIARGGSGSTNETAQLEAIARNFLVNGVDTKGLGITTQSSNSNGTYIKFETGIMICWHEMRTSSGANNTTGSIFRTNTTQWNFPASFVGTPIMIANPIGVAAECWAGMGASGVGTTSSSFMVWSTWNRGTSTINVGLVAIGRWR